MPFDWKKQKGYVPRKNGKTDSEMVLTTDQVQLIIKTIENGPAKPEKKARDRMAVLLGWHLALRVKETVLLDRSSFRDIEFPNGLPHVRTLKRSERILIVCQGCGSSTRVAASRDGQTWKCRNPECRQDIPIKKPKSRYVESGPPEIQPVSFGDLVRRDTINYINSLPPKQMWLFVGGNISKHMSPNHLEDIFGQYVLMAGLSPKYSWHALRHSRGSYVWETTTDQKSVQSALRQKSFGSSERYIHLSAKKKEMLANADNKINLG